MKSSTSMWKPESKLSYQSELCSNLNNASLCNLYLSDIHEAAPFATKQNVCVCLRDIYNENGSRFKNVRRINLDHKIICKWSRLKVI